MHSGAAGVFLAFGLNFGASLLTSTEGGATGLPATGSKVALPNLGAAGQPAAQPYPRATAAPQSGFLSLYYYGGLTRAKLIQTNRQNIDGTRSRKCFSPSFKCIIEGNPGASRSAVHRVDGRDKITSQVYI